MDNKEAAEVIAAMRKHEIDILKINAFELAIKALEQEPDAIHNEREQAYMKGYEDASKRYRTEPCADAISRTDAISVASGYCHWSNIPKELAKLPPVNPIPCEDAISRQAAIDAVEKTKAAMATDGEIYVAKINAEMNIQQLPFVNTEKVGRWKKIKSGDKNFPESIVCSRCGYENSYINEWNFNNEPLSKVFKTSKYCPNCGARMGEAGDET